MSFEDFQDGRHDSHLGHWNETILAILNLHVTPIPSTKFGLNLTLNLYVALMPPIKFRLNHLRFWEDMLFEEFQDGHHGSHQGYWNGMILAILNFYATPMPPIKFLLNLTWFGRRCLKNFKMAGTGLHGGHLGYPNGKILAILNLYVALMPPIKFQLNPTYGLGGDINWKMAAILDIGTEQF